MVERRIPAWQTEMTISHKNRGRRPTVYVERDEADAQIIMALGRMNSAIEREQGARDDIESLKRQLVDARAIADSRAEALDEQQRRWEAKLAEAMKSKNDPDKEEAQPPRTPEEGGSQ